MRIFKIAAAALLMSAPVFAQDEVARKQAVEVTTRVPFEKAMKSAPYSAETVVESSQTLADGNRITRKTTGRVYRDGEGRTRREEDNDVSAITANGPVAARMTSISIVDPVAGLSYSLDPEHKIAWRTPAGGTSVIMAKIDEMKLTAERQAAEAASVRTAPPDAKMKTGEPRMTEQQAAEAKMKVAAGVGGAGGEVMMRGRGFAYTPNNAPLEHKTIEGVAVEGRKTTTVVPAGAVGNEQPITITSEEWRSPELNLLVLTRHSDPRSGESSYRLTNIVRAEPDPSLFIVPPDYTVKDTGIRKMEEAALKRREK
jgi:hypothetical protein